MAKPKVFGLFLDNSRQIAMLSDVQAGRLIKALFQHANGEAEDDLSDDLALNLLYSMMAAQVDRDFQKYDEICEKRRKAGKAGAERKKYYQEQSFARQVEEAFAIKCKQYEDKYKDKYKDKYEDEYEEE